MESEEITLFHNEPLQEIISFHNELLLGPVSLRLNSLRPSDAYMRQ